jgi:plastocyanin
MKSSAWKSSVVAACLITAACAANAADEGTITGKVTFKGKPPGEKEIDMAADAKCKSLHETPASTRHYVVNGDGTLQNVLVYVKSGTGIEGKTFEAPKTKVTLDQKGCLYYPYVFGVMVNQELEIVNSDDTLHNVHALPTKNEDFNKGQPMKDMKFTHKFTKAEMPPIKFKCDVHPWMFAYCAVLPHPFFDVTREGGTFKISGLPPGRYLLQAWHHKAGILDRKVTVSENETEKITFEFSVQPAAR